MFIVLFVFFFILFYQYDFLLFYFYLSGKNFTSIQKKVCSSFHIILKVIFHREVCSYLYSMWCGFFLTDSVFYSRQILDSLPIPKFTGNYSRRGSLLFPHGQLNNVYREDWNTFHFIVRPCSLCPVGSVTRLEEDTSHG